MADLIAARLYSGIVPIDLSEWCLVSGSAVAVSWRIESPDRRFDFVLRLIAAMILGTFVVDKCNEFLLLLQLQPPPYRPLASEFKT